MSALTTTRARCMKTSLTSVQRTRLASIKAEQENGKKVKDEPHQECLAKPLRFFGILTDTKKNESHEAKTSARKHGNREETPMEITITIPDSQ